MWRLRYETTVLGRSLPNLRCESTWFGERHYDQPILRPRPGLR